MPSKKSRMQQRSSRKRMGLKQHEALRIGILKHLSINSRESLENIANDFGVSKSTVFHELNLIKGHYGIMFVPELSSKAISEKELALSLKSKPSNSASASPFKEYICLLKFSDKHPADEKLARVLNDQNMAQFAGRMFGAGYDVFIYLLSRSMKDIESYIASVSTSLPNAKFDIRVGQAVHEAGFFPVQNDFIKRLNLPASHKRMLINLNKDCRGKISNGFAKDAAARIHASLINSGIIKRNTIVMSKPDFKFLGLIAFQIKEPGKFAKKKNRIFSLLRKYIGEECRMVYAAQVFNPYALFVILNASSSNIFDEIKEKGEVLDAGIIIKRSAFTRTLFGHLGIRNLPNLEKLKSDADFNSKSKSKKQTRNRKRIGNKK